MNPDRKIGQFADPFRRPCGGQCRDSICGSISRSIVGSIGSRCCTGHLPGTLSLLLLACVIANATAQEAVRELGPEAAARTLRVRSTTDIEVFEPVLRAFLDSTPNIRIRYEQWGSNALFVHSDLDCRAGKAEADLVISSAVDQQVKLVNDGCAQAHRSVFTRRLAAHRRWRDELFGVTLEPAVMVYNREQIRAADVPHTRFDLIDLLRPIDTPFTGRVATYDIEQSGLGYLFAFADAQQASTSGALLEALGRSGAVATCCSAEIIDAVADGRYLLAYNVLGSYALARADNDTRIGVVAPQDYTLTLSRAALIPQRASEPGAAAGLIDYLLSNAGQAALTRARLIATFDENELAEFSSREGAAPVLRPIALSPSLLVGLDQMKRALFIRQWREKMVQ